jgi:tetratricopeptide (TPR) repeat protein
MPDPSEIRQIGPYPVRRFHAEGGMSWVFEVEDTRFGARRALKLLKPEAAVGDEFQRFEQEARMLAQIDHPNLITIYDFGRDEETGCHYYTMNLIEGPPIAQLEAVSSEETCRYFLDALSALAQLHARGIVHRDIKPQNIFLSPDGRAILGDLGIARVEGASGLTRTGTAIGTPLYMSPEQARGRPVGPQSDVFSVGLSLYRVLTGKTVYDEAEDVDSTSGQDVLMYLGSLLRTRREFEFGFRSGVPAAVQDVVRRACRLEPENRYPDARAMYEALLEAQRAPSEAEPSRGVSARAVAVAAVFALLVAAGAWWTYQRWMQGQTEALRDSTAGLAERATALVDSLESSDMPPTVALLEEARRDLNLARTALDAGERRFQAGKLSVAREDLREASGHFQRVCARRDEGHLTARADEEVGAVAGRLDPLRAVGAPDLRPDRWQELQGLLAELRVELPQAGACTHAGSLQARLGEAARGTSLALQLEHELEAEWPKLAEAAGAAAAEEREQAAAAKLDDPAWAEALARGEVAMQAGKRAVGAGSFLEARGQFDGAREAFREALVITPAARAREQVRELEEQARKRGIEDLGGLSYVVSRADTLYTDGSWAESAQEYVAAIERFDVLFNDFEASRKARELEPKVIAAREAAVAEGAERSAEELMAKATGLVRAGREAYEGRRYAEAEAHYTEARNAFGRAAEHAKQAMAEAREVAQSANRSHEVALGAGGCAELGGAARAECERAEEALARGNAALEQKDAPTALASLRAAGEGFRGSAAAQEDYLARLPKPPQIRARTPAAREVRVHRNQAVKLAVDAIDPNEDPLRFTWTSGREALASTSESLELRPTESMKVMLRVDDGHGGRAEARWDIVVTNRKPTLRLTPATSEAALEPGQTLPFRADARDPDGDPVEVTWLLDGKPVASGETYSFNARRTGEHTLVARAEDSARATREVRRRLTVRAKPEPVSEPVRPQTPPV